MKIGSQVFFSQYSDYKPHDEDFIEFVDNPTIFKNFINIKGKGKDIFIYRNMSSEEFKQIELKHCKDLPMAAGKFLVPALMNHFKYTINDLKEFEFAFNNLDNKHQYEKYIYDCYIKNNGFYLLKEQLDKAYNIYKISRNEDK